MSEPRLAPAFYEGLQERLPADLEVWEARLVALLEEARRRFPEVHLEGTLFARGLGASLRLRDTNEPRRTPPRGPEALLEKISGTGSYPELYLTIACANGDAPALGVFEREFISRLPERIGGLGCPPHLVGEVQQEVRCRLLTALQGPPRIGLYRGEGSLADWLTTTARRTVTDLRRRQRRVESLEDLADLPISRDGELEIARARYPSAFKAGLREACGSLKPEARNLLRMKYCVGLKQKQIARAFGVDEGTISRRLKVVQRQIFEEAKRSLRAGLGITSAELTSLERDLRSQLDLSLPALLAETD